MGKAMSSDTNNIIVRALAQGHTRTEIAKMCGVSTRAVTRVSTNLKKHGTARPPPSGLKQGRPAKLTRRQADALLGWITARDYTFYVKDLVAFLREHHAYQGCDGTVRRGMIRAGFKRKEPYHKSEITVWIPPNHFPQFDVILDEDQESRQRKVKSKAGTQKDLQQSSHAMASTTVTSQQEAPPAPMRGISPDLNSTLSSQQNCYAQVPGHLSQQQSMPPLDPSLYQMDAYAPAQPPVATKSPVRKAKKPKKEEELQNQVSTMQGELAKQSELIRQLQLQLAQSNAQAQDTQSTPIEDSGKCAEGIENAQQPPNDRHEQEEEVAV